MKKIILCVIAIAIASPSFAQWTTATNVNDIHNTNTGKVAIGTQTPYTTLDANSAVAGVARFSTSAVGNTSNIVVSNKIDCLRINSLELNLFNFF